MTSSSPLPLSLPLPRCLTASASLSLCLCYSASLSLPRSFARLFVRSCLRLAFHLHFIIVILFVPVRLPCSCLPRTCNGPATRHSLLRFGSTRHCAGLLALCVRALGFDTCVCLWVCWSVCMSLCVCVLLCVCVCVCAWQAFPPPAARICFSFKCLLPSPFLLPSSLPPSSCSTCIFY